jgi:hypothetical protein
MDIFGLVLVPIFLLSLKGKGWAGDDKVDAVIGDFGKKLTGVSAIGGSQRRGVNGSPANKALHRRPNLQRVNAIYRVSPV